jgi:alpha-2-macroglobulin
MSSLLLAASLKLLKVQASDLRAQAAVAEISAIKTPLNDAYANYYNDTIGHALDIYLLHKHFPQQASLLAPSVLERLLAPIAEGTNNTLSSALIMLALDAAAQNAKPIALSFEQSIASGASTAFGAKQGWLYSGSWTDTAVSLRINKPSGGPIWYAMTEAGFDQSVAGTKAGVGIEISKNYRDAQGALLTRDVQIGEELTVTLQLRSTDQQNHADIAMIDLLPGGFDTLSDGGNESAISSSAGAPENQEVREDRVVLYVSATPDVREYSYRIKATNVGRYTRPRSYAYSMYERKVQTTEAAPANSAAALTVVAPAH